MKRHVGGRTLRGLIVGIAAASAVYLALSLWAGWNDVATAFGQVGLPGTALILAMSLVNYGLRFMRWQFYLGPEAARLSWRAGLRIYLAGFALTMTPGKAGEAYRAVLLARHGVPFPTTFTALISERLADVAVIVIFSALGLRLFPQMQAATLAGAALIAVFIVLTSNKTLLLRLHARLLARCGRLRAWLAHPLQIMLAVRGNLAPRVLLPALLIGAVAWGVEGLAFYWVLGWMGTDISPVFAVFVYSVSMLAGAVSMLPGGIGGAEAVMVSLLVYGGIPLPQAIAATVFIRLTTLWFAVLIGLAALARSRHGKEAA